MSFPPLLLRWGARRWMRWRATGAQWALRVGPGQGAAGGARAPCVPGSPTSVRAPRAKQPAMTPAHSAVAAAAAAGLLTWRTMKRKLEGSEPQAKSALCTNSGGARARV